MKNSLKAKNMQGNISDTLGIPTNQNEGQYAD